MQPFFVSYRLLSIDLNPRYETIKNSQTGYEP